MKNYTVKACIVVNVEAEDENGAIEQATYQVREMKPSDFEYGVEEIPKKEVNNG